MMVPHGLMSIFPPPNLPSIIAFVPTAQPYGPSVALPIKVSTASFVFAATARPIELTFFSTVWPIAAASSVVLRSSSVAVFGRNFTTVVASLCPVWRVTGSTFFNALVMGLPSGSMVIPISFRSFYAARTPVVNYPSILRIAFPFAIVFYPREASAGTGEGRALREVFLFFVVLDVDLVLLVWGCRCSLCHYYGLQLVCIGQLGGVFRELWCLLRASLFCKVSRIFLLIVNLVCMLWGCQL